MKYAGNRNSDSLHRGIGHDAVDQRLNLFSGLGSSTVLVVNVEIVADAEVSATDFGLNEHGFA